MSEPEDPFVCQVRRQVERRDQERRFHLWEGLGMVGSVGWTVSVPAVLGAVLGRWLDSRFEAGVKWTLVTMTLGVALGCIAAWRHLKQVIQR